MDIQELRREAQTMHPQLTADRRRLHRNPEAGAVLPETVAYVKERLTEIVAACGLDPSVRGERLGLAEYARLADALAAEKEG